MEQRTVCVVDRDITERDVAELTCAAVLDVLGPVLGAVHIDAASPLNPAITADARAAEEVLRAVGVTQHPDSADPRMGVRVEAGRSPAAQWSAVRAYAPWAVQVDLWDDAGQWLGELEEAGYTVRVALTPSELVVLQERLRDVGAIVPRDELERARRSGARAARLRRLRGWASLRRT